MVIIYGNQRCGWCHKAKELASSRGLEYEWKDTDDFEILNELKIKIPNVKTIPQIWWNDEYVGGYDDFAAAIENILGGNFGNQVF
jgi:glutaredoxin